MELLNSAPGKKIVNASGLHPLDPLTADEVALAAKTCREVAAKKGQAPLRFNAISLKVRSPPLSRQVDAILGDPARSCILLAYHAV